MLILPPGRKRADGPFPLVTIVHGGPCSRWADELMVGWWSWGQWLAAAGFAVFHPNPRGSQGHGREFAAMVGGAVGQGEWTDILAGLDDLVASGVAAPATLGIAGWSHGGFMAAWAVTQTGRFRAAVMAAGVADWAMQVTTPTSPSARRCTSTGPSPSSASSTTWWLSAREPRVHRAGPPDRRPGTRSLLVHPLARALSGHLTSGSNIGRRLIVNRVRDPTSGGSRWLSSHRSQTDSC